MAPRCLAAPAPPPRSGPVTADELGAGPVQDQGAGGGWTPLPQERREGDVEPVSFVASRRAAPSSRLLCRCGSAGQGPGRVRPLSLGCIPSPIC